MPEPSLSPDSTVLGFDVGSRRIGVAIGSAFSVGARALAMVDVRADGPDWAALDRLHKEWRPNGLIVGDPLTLIREPDNRHDRNAIRVEWRGHKLGYVPRAQNAVVAAAMDAGDRLSARVSSLSDNKNPWLRVAFEVYLDL